MATKQTNRRTLAQKLRAMYFIATDTHDENGMEKPDPTPMEMPAGFKRPPTLHEMIQQALRGQRIMEAQRARGEETLEESMDYEVDEEPDPISHHQVRALQEEFLQEGRMEAEKQARIAARKAKEKPKAEDPPKETPKA